MRRGFIIYHAYEICLVILYYNCGFRILYRHYHGKGIIECGELLRESLRRFLNASDLNVRIFTGYYNYAKATHIFIYRKLGSNGNSTRYTFASRMGRNKSAHSKDTFHL